MSDGELPTKGVSRIAGLVIINALIFQEVLSSFDARVKNISFLIRDAKKEKKSLATIFTDHWEFIVAEIDYYPIFHLASELLLHLPSVGVVDEALIQLGNRAQTIVGKKAALRHDLMGRIFHRMLLEAKYLATYYTSIPAATMSLRTALRPELWAIDWSSLETIKDFKVADLACGTGTLLMAAADSIADNAIKRFNPNFGDLSKFHKEVHRLLAEEVIHGYNVLPTALHLTAATLAMRAPEVVFEKMNLFSMPLGGKFHRLGSLDFLEMDQLSFDDLFGAASEVVSSKGKKQTPNVALPFLNLVAINPPFRDC